MFKVEQVMKLSLKEVTANAVEAYPTTEREKWVVSWPGQVILASSTIHWTTEVTDVSLRPIIITHNSFYGEVQIR